MIPKRNSIGEEEYSFMNPDSMINYYQNSSQRIFLL